MLAGEAQVGNPETVAGLIANQNGANFVNIMNYQKTILFELFVRSDIKTPQDLKGKKMGINRFGATAEAMSRIMLKKLGLDPYKDMSFIQVGGGTDRASGARRRNRIRIRAWWKNRPIAGWPLFWRPTSSAIRG